MKFLRLNSTSLRFCGILSIFVLGALKSSLLAQPQIAEFPQPNEIEVYEAAQFALPTKTLEISPGDILFLRVHLKTDGLCLDSQNSPRPNCQLKINFLEQESTLYPLKNNSTQWGAFLGVDMNHPPGASVLQFNFSNQKGIKFAQSIPVQVSLKKFPVIKLRVSPKMVNYSKKIQERIQKELQVIRNIMADSHQEALWNETRLPVATHVNTFFGTTRVFNKSKKSPHTGVDLKAHQGMPVQPLTRGRVVFTGNLYLAGKTVIVDHGHHIFTGYMHLSKILSSPQDVLEAGQNVGLAGKTGRATGPHLHWIANIGGKRVDPLQLYQALLKI